MSRLAVLRSCISPTRLSLQRYLPSLYLSSLGVNSASILSQLSASRRRASTGTGNPRPPTPRTLKTKLERTLNVFGKLQPLSNDNSPDIIGSIVVENNEGLLFFDSAGALIFSYTRIVLILP